MSAPDHRDGRAGEVRGESNLRTRAASAAVLIPIALIATYIGGWLFVVLCMVAAGGILWEWTSLAAGRAEARVLVPGGAGLLIAGALAGLSLPSAAAGVVLAEAVLAALAIVAWPRDDESLDPAGWAAGGVVYAGAALLPSIILRNDPNWGLTAVYFLFATVWITDIFAYFVGRLIGGPLLWPAVSPKKTWSGAIGGAVGGIAAGIGVAYAAGTAKLGIVGIMALLLSVLSPSRRFVRIRREAAIWRKGCKPAHPRSWGADGPARRLYCRRPGRRADRHLARRSGFAREGLTGMVSR